MQITHQEDGHPLVDSDGDCRSLRYSFGRREARSRDTIRPSAGETLRQLRALANASRTHLPMTVEGRLPQNGPCIATKASYVRNAARYQLLSSYIGTMKHRTLNFACRVFGNLLGFS